MTLSRINWDAVAIAMLLLVVMALGVALKLQSSSKNTAHATDQATGAGKGFI